MLLISCGYGGHGFRNTTTTEGSVWIGFGSYHHDSRVRLDWFRLTPPRPKGPFGLVMLTAHPKRVWVWFWLVCLGLHRDPTRVRLVCLLPTVAAQFTPKGAIVCCSFQPTRACLFVYSTHHYGAQKGTVWLVRLGPHNSPYGVRFYVLFSAQGCMWSCLFQHQYDAFGCSPRGVFVFDLIQPT